MTTTKQSRKPKRKTGSLKMLLLTSSLVATMTGTHLLNIKEALQPANVLAENNVPALVESAPAVTTIIMPPSGGRQQIVKQIPQVVRPRIRSVARSRSSS